MSLEGSVLNYLSENENVLISLSKDIWGHPQLALEETYASKLIAGQLEEAGFAVKKGVAQIPTAFVASWGEGKPIIGILGEYDALPGLSQKVSTKKEPIEEGAAGHGCGHNLLGVGSLGAALAVKEEMKKDRIKGTIRYYGCPAEETLIGKVFMAQAGVFDDIDAAICWHPMHINAIRSCSFLALNSFKLNFHGVSTHAAVAPEMGRSALDGVVLTDVGVNYLREHIIQEARIHCVITNGGLAPNVVPSYAQVWYYVRAPHRDQVDEIYSRILDIAKGAALMSGTTCDVEFIGGCYDVIPNDVIGRIMLEKLERIGAPRFTEEEKTFAKQLQATLSPSAVESALRNSGLTKEEIGEPLCDKILDRVDSLAKGRTRPASTDVGDVSYVTPTGQFATCCVPLGVALHSWQSTASVGSTIGFKGMMLAAKTLALTGLDLVTRPDVLRAAHNEFKKTTRGKKYVSPLPEGFTPPTKKSAPSRWRGV